MRTRLMTTLALVGLVGLAACDRSPPTGPEEARLTAADPPAPVKRWYSDEQVARGEGLFQQYCASCHKPDASGTPNWRETDAEGKLPPPPINGTAHAWHHPLSILRRTVRIGGVPLGGSMPAFADKLNAAQIDDILAWVQSRWPEEIYKAWNRMNSQAASSIQPINKGS